MSETVLAAIITASIGLIGTVIAVIVSAVVTIKTVQNKLEVGLAVTETKLDNLRAEVKKHNEFAVRIPRIEQQQENNVKAIDRLERVVFAGGKSA